MLIRRSERFVRRAALADALQGPSQGGFDRRTFLRRSGLAAGSLATLGALPLTGMRKAEAGPPPPPGAQGTIRKKNCTHCSVGCTVVAGIADGVGVGEEPGGGLPPQHRWPCAQGASRGGA